MPQQEHYFKGKHKRRTKNYFVDEQEFSNMSHENVIFDSNTAIEPP